MKRVLSEETVAEIIKRKQSGESSRQIAKEIGTSEQNVNYWFKKFNNQKVAVGSGMFNNRRRCSTCRYQGYRGTCDYLLKTGKRRGCSADACTVYEERKGKRDKSKAMTVKRGERITDVPESEYDESDFERLAYSQEII